MRQVAPSALHTDSDLARHGFQIRSVPDIRIEVDEDPTFSFTDFGAEVELTEEDAPEEFFRQPFVVRA
jgi:hypothetical protein